MENIELTVIDTPAIADTDSVRNPDILSKRLKLLHDTCGLSWREISQIPDFIPVPPGTLCTWANTGYLPRKWYSHFGFTVVIPVPACPVHGVVHCYDCATQQVKPVNKRKPKPRLPRISIRLDDPASAAKSIKKHMSGDTLAALVELLD